MAMPIGNLPLLLGDLRPVWEADFILANRVVVSFVLSVFFPGFLSVLGSGSGRGQLIRYMSPIPAFFVALHPFVGGYRQPR